MSESKVENMSSEGEKSFKRLVLERVEQLGIAPNEKLGQHFLIDQPSIQLLGQSVNPGNVVVEVGAGVGQLTEELAERASRVISVEIDRRFEPVLETIAKTHPNVELVYGDILALDLKRLIQKHRGEEVVQIVASLPFHITEPFLHQIAGVEVEDVTLVIGKKFYHAIQARNEDDVNFSKLTLLTQTFFNIDVVSQIEKKKFYPVPRTDSTIVRLTPKGEPEFKFNKRDFLFRRLFLTAKKNPLVKNSLKESLIEFTAVSRSGTLSKSEYHRKQRGSVRSSLKRIAQDYNHLGDVPQPESFEEGEAELTQNEARALIEKMGIPDDILDRPFGQLTNRELQVLSKALREN